MTNTASGVFVSTSIFGRGICLALSSHQRRRIAAWHVEDAIWCELGRGEGAERDGQTDGQRYKADSETDSRREQATANEKRSADHVIRWWMAAELSRPVGARETNARSPQNAITQLFWRRRLSIIVAKAKPSLSGESSSLVGPGSPGYWVRAKNPSISTLHDDCIMKMAMASYPMRLWIKYLIVGV